MNNKKTALVTGASSGIGRVTAIKLQENGYNVYGAARRVNLLEELESFGVKGLYLDLTDEGSIADCVNAVLEREGRIDLLVNDAGYGSYGAVEDVPISEAQRQFDVNVFGLARMIQLVLPKMREHKYGKIVNISSMGGRIWTPFGAWYHATKFAVEGLSACLRLEVKPFGIDVIVIEPGGIKTDWGAIAMDNLEKVSAGGAYVKTVENYAKSMRNMYEGSMSKMLTPPQKIADCILKAVTVHNPKTRYLLGFGAREFVAIQRLFGDKAYDKFITRMNGIK